MGLRFLGAWTIQALWVVLVQMPVILICSVEGTAPPIALRINALWLLVWMAAFLLEAVADVQKLEFRQEAANKHKFITTGLWRYARHLSAHCLKRPAR